MTSNSAKFFQYMKHIGQLKQVERTGWVRNKVKDPESVAEHMYRMAMMAFALPSDSGLDRDKCIKMALVHDMAECVVGDITPWCGVNKEEKNRREKEATSHIASLIPEEGRKEMYELWLEYESQSSPEAKFVKDLDKFEMLFQAYEYENLHDKPRYLQEFYDHTQESYKFSTDIVRGWSQDLIHMREKETSNSTTTAVAAESSSEGTMVHLPQENKPKGEPLSSESKKIKDGEQTHNKGCT